MLRGEEGQITVFLSLVFLVMMGLFLCVLEGMYCFVESSLAEDAMKGAGNYVLANYNRALFERYHLLFLDPRERGAIEEDGKRYLSGYSGEKSVFQFSCTRLKVAGERTAVDEDGRYLQHQIREWMKYREVAKAGKALRELFRTAAEGKTGTSLARTNMGQAEAAVAAAEQKEDAAQGDSTGHENTASQTQEDETENGGTESTAEDAGQTGMRWKAMKDLLTTLTKAGILMYVTDDVGELSQLSVSAEGLPSAQQASEKDTADFFGSTLSFLNVSEWKKIIEQIRVEDWNSQMLVDEFYLLEYIEESFGSYVREMDGESALCYETEYLIAGKDSDMENLKAVANRILCLRFLSNYVYLSQSGEWNAAAGSAAAALMGVFGFPQAAKAVQVLLTAAVSLGESMLDVHALFAGEKVPIMKDAATWNLTLENAATLLQNRGPVKEGKVNAEYEDYLKLLLASRLQRSRLLLRMMDLMQLNIALEETGFLMEECLFAFRWEAEFACGGLFSFFPGVGRTGDGVTLEMERWNSY